MPKIKDGSKSYDLRIVATVQISDIKVAQVLQLPIEFTLTRSIMHLVVARACEHLQAKVPISSKH